MARKAALEIVIELCSYTSEIVCLPSLIDSIFILQDFINSTIKFCFLLGFCNKIKFAFTENFLVL